MDLGQKLIYCLEKTENWFKWQMSHALHKLHMHVEWGIRALIVYLDSNCDNVCMIGEFIGSTQALDTS